VPLTDALAMLTGKVLTAQSVSAPLDLPGLMLPLLLELTSLIGMLSAPTRVLVIEPLVCAIALLDTKERDAKDNPALILALDTDNATSLKSFLPFPSLQTQTMDLDMLLTGLMSSEVAKVLSLRLLTPLPLPQDITLGMPPSNKVVFAMLVMRVLTAP
jgi:hypothetical protein